MTAKIIGVTSQKGGAGKSTLAMSMAGTLGKRGHRVLVVDTDKQGTAVRWAAGAPDDSPFPAHVVNLSAAEAGVGKEVKKYIDDYRYIIVDTPPSIESIFPRLVLAFSDFALIPTRPSSVDLWAGEGMTRLVAETRGAYNPDLIVRTVANQVRERTQIAQAGIRVLDKSADIPCLHTRLHLRTAFEKAAVLGLPVQDVLENKKQDLRAIGEIEAMTDEVLDLLDLEEVPSGAVELVGGVG